MPNKILDELIAAGVSSDTVMAVAALISSSESPRSILGTSAEIILSRRRKADRERKKAAYLLAKHGGGKQTMSAVFSEEKLANEIAASSLTSLLTSLPVSVEEATKQGSKKEVVSRRDRGARIPPGWRLSPELTALAHEHGHVPREFETEFKDFWVGVPGARGRKCDWEATARNRIKETSKRRRNANGYGQPRPGSREDRAERTAVAMEKLRNFANGHDPDDQGAGGEAGEPSFGGLPFPKPA